MKIDMYKDYQFKVWVVRIIDNEGNQIGDCDYAHLKKDAKELGLEMLREAKEISFKRRG